ncbi:transcription factor TGAL1 isoform X1 [Oryza brachyantha]|uniref:transcription factor TGAL1 isoform X1 n=1 Tax=Oryza brachyantha TaxID=4533 RepID=UPI001ADB25D5|nr:transcription factor TGAL1 isoform X1 [Oryza brachyantha]
MDSRLGGAAAGAAAASDARGGMSAGLAAPHHAIHTNVNNMQHTQVTDFGALAQSAGFRIEDLANLSTNSLFNLKSNAHTIINDPLQFGNYGKSIPPSNITTTAAVTVVDPQTLVPEMGAQLNLATIRTGNVENWGESTMADTSPRTDTSTDPDTDERNQMQFEQGQLAAPTASDSSDRSKDKLDHKTLRRLAQNREAARKSRLRKKAYIQNLETSRLKLTQLEQELQRARQQGIFISTTGDQSHSVSGNGALAFDMEYARWLEEHNKHINELRAAVNSHASDNDLRSIVDNIMAHYDEIFKLKGVAAKADVFHVLSGMWKTPAERCFMWLGGFRSSELLKLLAGQLEPLTEQQLAGIANLQQSSQQAEDALSQGMEALQQSLAETLASGSLGPAGSSGNVANYMGQMAMAMGKLGTLENFLRQADNLRLQTLQQMQRILTTRQSARALLAISDYFSRLRALSSLWLARPRE